MQANYDGGTKGHSTEERLQEVYDKAKDLTPDHKLDAKVWTEWRKVKKTFDVTEGAVMKEWESWESEIVIRIHDMGREAPTEEAYRQLVKDQFREDYNFELTDAEITEVKAVTLRIGRFDNSL